MMTCNPCKAEHVLDRRVTIQQQKSDATPDGHGGVNLNDDDNWEEYATRWAEIKTRGGSERFASDLIQAGQSHRIYLRWDPTTKGITPLMRVKYGTRIMGIMAAEDIDQRHQWMQLDVGEAKAE